MASLKDAVQLTTQLNELTQQLHAELTEGDVDFEPAGQQKHPVDRRARRQVPMVHGGEVPVETHPQAFQRFAQPPMD